MAISSISSSESLYTSALQQQPQVQEARPDRENDADSDDKTSAPKPPSPTVNMNGQSIGNILNEIA